MSEFLTIGEPITLFASEEIDKELKEANHFQKFLAGAEVNVAVGVSRLGHSTQYITRLGQDPFGEFIKDSLLENKVGTDYIDETDEFWTAFQLKQKVSEGDPGIFYFRKGSAAAHFDESVFDRIDFEEVKLIHLSGIFPALSDQNLAAFKTFIRLAKKNKITLTYDPNLRPQLWSSEEKMISTINALAEQADIVMPGIAEGKVLMGSDGPEKIADFYLAKGVPLVIVKLGEKGAFVKSKDEQYTVKGFEVEKVIDTVGAGDGFAVGIITGILENLSLKESVMRGNAIGALAVQAPGDNDGYPTKEMLNHFLKEHK